MGQQAADVGIHVVPGMDAAGQLGDVVDRLDAVFQKRSAAEVAYAAENERMRVYLKTLERRLVPEHQGSLLMTCWEATHLLAAGPQPRTAISCGRWSHGFPAGLRPWPEI